MLKQLTFRSLMMGCSGLISNILLPLMNSKLVVSPRVWALINLFKRLKENFNSLYGKGEYFSHGLFVLIYKAGLNKPFHVSRPPKLSGNQYTWWRAQSFWDLHFCHLISQLLLYPITKKIVLLFRFSFFHFILVSCNTNQINTRQIWSTDLVNPWSRKLTSLLTKLQIFLAYVNKLLFLVRL